MTTEILRDTPKDIDRAGEILRSGGLVALPTETVYGLAANALDPRAVKSIYTAKGRPSDNPLIVHISNVDQWRPLVQDLPAQALALAEAFWPGPLTVILKKSDIIPLETSGGLDTIGVRCPANSMARAVIDAAGMPLAAPSANISGRPSPTGFTDTLSHLNGRVDAVLDGGDCAVGVESTVISLAGDVPRILRPGGATAEDLRRVLGQVDIDPAVTAMLKPGAKPMSPGMKYKHYAPKAQVIMVDGSPEEFAERVNTWVEERSELAGQTAALCFDETAALLRAQAVTYGSRYNQEMQARQLFSALHRLDERGVSQVFAQRPSPRGVGLAVYNRLLRAAAFQVEYPDAPPIIGLSGPSGAGKSTAAALLQQRGFGLVDCDQLTRSPQVYDEACVEKLRQAFGDQVAPQGVLDRRALAAQAFSSPEGVALLESITFPPIEAAVRREVEALRDQGKPVLLDAPTLFEAGLDSLCRRLLVVTAPEPLRLARIIERDGLREEEAVRRFRAQKTGDFYESHGDWIIENAPGQDLESQVETISQEIFREWKGR